MLKRNEHGDTGPLVALIAGIVVVVCFTLAACVAVFVAAPEGAETGSLITILLGQLAPTLAVLALLAKHAQTEQKVNTITSNTGELANGLMDAKIRAAVADVVADDLIDPTALQQIAADRVRRDRVNPYVAPNATPR